MENAAKALVMAGGILLAIMTLSLLVYMVGSTSRMAEAQDQKKVAEQLAAFNNEYEAYNKRVMYGTEIISVINKAIVHNEKMEASVTDNPYYINIKLKTTQNFETTFEHIYTDPDDPENSSYDDNIDPDVRANEFNGKNAALDLFAGDYALGTFQEENKEFITKDKDFKEFFKNNKTDMVVEKGDHTYKMYSALANFKRAIFRCEEVIYKDGRVQEMHFVQRR